VRDLLESVQDAIEVPDHLYEPMYYDASGNFARPACEMTRAIHGVDVSAWSDFDRANLDAVIGSDGIRVGSSDF